MSNYYLCDVCANKAGDSMFFRDAVKCWQHSDNVPKKVMLDSPDFPYDEPLKVCPSYKPKRAEFST